MAKRLSETAITKATPKAKPYEKRFASKIILRVQPSGVKTLWCQHGRGKRIKLGDVGVTTIEKAEYKARQILNEVADHGSPLKRGLKKGTLAGFIEGDYATWLKANRKRGEKTLGDLRRCFKDIADLPLVAITRDHLDEYVSTRIDAGVMKNTINRDLNNLQGLMRLAEEKNYIRETPFRKWKKPKGEDIGVTQYLDADEEKRLRKALKARDDKARAERVSANAWRTERGYDLFPEIASDEYSDHLTPMVLLSLNTGMRYGEVAKLGWHAIDFKARAVTVLSATSKGQKTAIIPLNDEVIDVLNRWKKSGTGAGLVFPSTDADATGDEPIGTVKTAWGSTLKAAEIENFRWHDLRHSFASRLVQRGVDLTVVNKLMRHSDFKQTLRYAHLAPSQLVDAVAKLMG